MSPSSETPVDQPQIRPLRATSDLDLALVDLIGDLAAYRPNGKVVIFEGGGDSDLDRNVTARLFPELQESANLISGSNKARVRSLRALLEAATESAGLPFTFHCITDMDSEPPVEGASVKQHSWDVYHLENYFLEAEYIRDVLIALGSQNPPSPEAIWDDLRSCAQETLPQIVRHDLAEFANAHLISAIDVGTDPKKGDLVGELFAAAERSKTRVEGLLSTDLSEDKLKGEQERIREQYDSALADGSWHKVFRGRDILRRFAGKRASSVSYEVFRNLIVSRMADRGYQPPGMKAVIDAIIAA